MPSTALEVPADHPAFAGHFPGRPLLPGVLLLAEALEAVHADPALAAVVGPTPQLSQVKFLAPVRPGARLTIDLELGARGVGFEVREGNRVAAAGRFEAAA